MTTTEMLLDAARDIWAEYNAHPFVQGIQNGTLDRERFRYYMIQDYLYLEDYLKVFALGLAKAKSRQTAQMFAGYITLLTGTEMDIHRGYMGRLAITQEELDGTARALDSLSYTSYMIRTAYEGEEPEILTATLACAYSYQVIAHRMAEEYPAAVEDEFYGDWVKGYISPEYAQGNQRLMEMVDRLTGQYTQPQLDKLREIFVACSRYELAFWDMAWEMKE